MTAVVESHNSGRTQAFALGKLRAKLLTGAISSDVDAAEIAAQVIRAFPDCNTNVLAGAVAWRDLCAMTGRLRTFHGSNSVQTTGKAPSAVESKGFCFDAEVKYGRPGGARSCVDTSTLRIQDYQLLFWLDVHCSGRG
ncbi:hypothetical protein PV08_03680 [Exophiala spinifera]|uniref:Uncharacterized protein n=1 Tax=Exophiala spinifera TaxID=91928 RepID=A0A0D2BLD6_9EURO|nr:uncharacterized protein PV08_03680 [Exophiala spinifera]KIW19385.1 hypothetical protein PV08_03680 [Exophiala spinifera]